MVGEGAQVLCGGNRGKFSKLGARSGPRTRSARKSGPLEMTTVDSLADSPADSWYMFYFVTTVTH